MKIHFIVNDHVTTCPMCSVPDLGRNHYNFDFLWGSPVFYEQVDHAFRLYEKITSQEKDAENHGQRQYAQHSNLH